MILDDRPIVDYDRFSETFNEIVMLSQINHKHVVKLLGCCLETTSPYLIYEFVSNGSLSQHIHQPHLSRRISWGNRLRIANEIADAITYLHIAKSKTILHRDIRSSNILLDEKYTAKVTDFTLAISIPSGQKHVESAVAGIYSHVDHEYMCTGRLTEKSDVFSYGLVLLELLTGKRALDRGREDMWLGDIVISCMEKNCLASVLDTGILNEGRTEQVTDFAQIALRCIKEKAEERPTMKEAAQELRRMRKLVYSS